VEVTITPPSGAAKARTRTWHANKIGWLYDPSFDFVADEAGRWTVDVAVTHDRVYAPTGLPPTDHNTGTVLGTDGQYEFYVVAPESRRLPVTEPQPGFVSWDEGGVEPIPIEGGIAGTTALGGATTEDATTVYYTVHDKGVVMAQGSVTPDAAGRFSFDYDARALHETFPFLSLTAREGYWEGLADEVSINLLKVGGGPPRANTVTLIGEEIFVRNDEIEAVGAIYLPVILKGE
jgi:hypothetical protein